MQDATAVARQQSTRAQTPLYFKFYVLRESLSADSQNIPCAILKRTGLWAISVYLCSNLSSPTISLMLKNLITFHLSSGLRHKQLTFCNLSTLSCLREPTLSFLLNQRSNRIHPGEIYRRILIFTHPGSRISDPGSKNRNKREGWKKFVVIPFFIHKFHKIVNYFIFEMLKKKIWANFRRIIELFTQKIVTNSQKYGFRIRKKPIQDPGVKKAPDPGSGSETLKYRHLHIQQCKKDSKYTDNTHLYNFRLSYSAL